MPRTTDPAASVDAKDLTFGIELECFVPAALDIAIGPHGYGEQIRQLPPGWKGDRDPSIHPPAGYKACEVVSPVLKGADGLRQVVFAIAWLKSVGAKVNASCGCHIHVGLPERGRTVDLGKVVAMFARHETALFAITGTKRREETRWCKPIRDAYAFSKLKNGDRDAHEAHNLPTGRYFTLNLSNLASGRRPTVECRAFSGTLNATKVLGYVSVCLGLVERALNSKRSISWDMERTERQNARHAVRGVGKHAAMELVYGLNWKGGGRPYGMVPADGMPSTPALVAELYRLAEKYDACDESEAD
jgi:hypothetical protein